MADCGTITVVGTVDESNVTVDSCTIGTDSVEVGEEFDVTATVTNDNQADASVEVVLSLNGSEEDTETITVGANDSEDVVFTLTADSPGDLSFSTDKGSVSRA